jgi:hypothetical protein
VPDLSLSIALLSICLVVRQMWISTEDAESAHMSF